MKVKNHSHPHKTQMDGFFEGDTETPIAMLNLLKFKENYYLFKALLNNYIYQMFHQKILH